MEEAVFLKTFEYRARLGGKPSDEMVYKVDASNK